MSGRHAWPPPSRGPAPCAESVWETPGEYVISLDVNEDTFMESIGFVRRTDENRTERRPSLDERLRTVAGVKDEPATFEAAMARVLGECVDIGMTRGQEYDDSWSIENIVTTFTGSTVKKLTGCSLSRDELRLIIAAAVVDLKDQRIAAGGAWKRDTMIDGINYRALYTDLREGLEADLTE
jgi:hypothetical protein